MRVWHVWLRVVDGRVVEVRRGPATSPGADWWALTRYAPGGVVPVVGATVDDEMSEEIRGRIYAVRGATWRSAGGARTGRSASGAIALDVH